MSRYSCCIWRVGAVALLATLLAASASLPHAATAFARQDATAATPNPGSSAPLAWDPCPDAADWECATLAVSLDYAQPAGETLAWR